MAYEAKGVVEICQRKVQTKRKKAKDGTQGFPMFRSLAEEKGLAKETENMPVRKGKVMPPQT